MPTPNAYYRLLDEHEELKRAAFRFLMSTYQPAIDEYRKELWELVRDYEPTEAEQGLIPIPDGYAEP